MWRFKMGVSELKGHKSNIYSDHITQIQFIDRLFYLD